MEARVGGLLFTSKFDSGNLARVEKVSKEEDESDNDTSKSNFYSSVETKADSEFNVWTNPDCGGTEFENPNRSWFYFGIRGWNTNKVIKINVMNMNRQGKLYSQGLTPFVRILPGKPKWERIRDRPSCETVDGQFILSFTYRFPEFKGGTVYFAFCFPWSYAESQEQQQQLDKKFSICQTYNSKTHPEKIYYHRELLAYSLDKLRIDLMTISSCHGLTDYVEPRFDQNLFPDKETPRCKRFKGKRVFILSSRVHPGETPASFVFNGFLNFILREDDPRAAQLRRQFVFKLVPMLNPDGVMRGHYRTDPRGVNLNRVYLDPNPQTHPSIYAAKSLIVFHHVQERDRLEPGVAGVNVAFPGCERGVASPSDELLLHTYGSMFQSLARTKKHAIHAANCFLFFFCSALSFGMIDSDTDDDDESKNTFTEHLGNEGSDDEGGGEADIDFLEGGGGDGSNAPHLRDPALLQIPPHASGVAIYVDLHGHASKRGCFIYGNYFESEDLTCFLCHQVENMLFPKLVSMNTAHFDFTGCNFSEKNMYTKDKRDGMSKEGSGRVAIYKATGIIHSYTLECNYNTGRLVNPVPPAYGDDGRATPPPTASFPPKYTIAHYEEVGKAVAIAALDMTDSNPWSRITLSEHNSIYAVREAVRRYLRGLRGLPRVARANSLRGGKNVGPSPLSQTRRTSMGDNSSSTSGTGSNSGTSKGFRPGQEVSQRLYPRPTNPSRRELAPVREATRNTGPSNQQTSRRRSSYNSSNGPGSNIARATAGVAVTLNLTTADVDHPHHFSHPRAAGAGAAGNNGFNTQLSRLSSDSGSLKPSREGDLVSLKSRESEGSASLRSRESSVSQRFREDKKLQQLKQVNMVGNKRPGPNARIPLPTARSQFHLSTSPGHDLAPPSIRTGRHSSSSSSYHQPPPHHNAMTSTVGTNSRASRQTKSGPATTSVKNTDADEAGGATNAKTSGAIGVTGVMARRAQSEGVVTTGSNGGALHNHSRSEASILNSESANGKAPGGARGVSGVPVNKPLPFANDEGGEPMLERGAADANVDKRHRKPQYPSNSKNNSNSTKAGANGPSSNVHTKGQHLQQLVDTGVGGGGEESETGSASSTRRKGRLSRRRKMRKFRANSNPVPLAAVNSNKTTHTPSASSPALVPPYPQRGSCASVEGSDYPPLLGEGENGLPLMGQVDPDLVSSHSPGRDSAFYTDRQQGGKGKSRKSGAVVLTPRASISAGASLLHKASCTGEPLTPARRSSNRAGLKSEPAPSSVRSSKLRSIFWVEPRTSDWGTNALLFEPVRLPLRLAGSFLTEPLLSGFVENLKVCDPTLPPDAKDQPEAARVEMFQQIGVRAAQSPQKAGDDDGVIDRNFCELLDVMLFQDACW
ncbi:hypothetical protein EGW08_018108 [Elysia chlorotica]|uniref:Cytosolic carboxypeptidase-like protein 5 n=1 Tax=Elysia chlorotica TaxID=188477 RepID=A0A3S0ZSF0_ELYCH|nr:hypothetical protein EGW08_018108 [Elysia chlorotica]